MIKWRPTPNMIWPSCCRLVCATKQNYSELTVGGGSSGLGETEGLIEQLKQTEVGELVDDLLMIARTG